MKEVIFATGNDYKVVVAQHVMTAHGIKLVQKHIDIDEIQSEDGEHLVRDKAQKAFDIVKKPIVVNDDWWEFPGLNGFPGPYMKSINQWFTPEDLVRLTKPLKDRRAILRQYIVYQDAEGQHVFSKDIEGELLKEAHGKVGEPNYFVITFDGTNSIAEIMECGESAIAHRKNVWHELGPWLEKHLAVTDI